MSVLVDLLLGLGGKALASVIGKKLGPEMGDLSKAAIDALATMFGSEPTEDAVAAKVQELQDTNPKEAQARVAYAEADIAPQLLAQAELWKAANEQQQMTNELLMAEQKQGGPAAWWLWLWQYLLMGFWGWSVFVVPIGNAVLKIAGQPDALAAPDLTILMTLTGAYLALHMGGHTVLELMRGGTFSASGTGSSGKGKS